MNTYTVITFAPVQGFIEKSRKLRDLYGSSYILSLLSWVICQSVKQQIGSHSVVSPASINITQGMPNQIIVKGDLSLDQINEIKKTFTLAWEYLVHTCRIWIEDNIKDNLNQWDYQFWRRDWQLWVNYCWEFFWASGNTITQARENLNQQKNSRDWTGINWQGESSTLSGSDAICYPNLGKPTDPRDYNYQQEKNTIRDFYQSLSDKLGEAFIEPREELSIPELVKRMITHQTIVDELKPRLEQLNLGLPTDKIKEISLELSPDSFRDLNRHKEDETNEQKYWTGWFLGDGDSASKYFKSLPPDQEEIKLHEFSATMRKWGKDLKENQAEYLQNKGRIIYAGGDDFLGVLYDGAKLVPYDCLQWFYDFKSKVWHGNNPKIINVSVGFVWAGNQVPQRDILQHCHSAESSAKSNGRDRIAFRILFNSGNYLEWVCPWWLLDSGDKLNLIESYRDRNKTSLKNDGNWNHFYQDIAVLEARHAFESRTLTAAQIKEQNLSISNDIAFGLIDIYFGETWRDIIANSENWWNKYDNNELQIFTGILGDPKQFNSNDQETPDFQQTRVKQALNNWVINLAKIGFYLTDKGVIQ